MRKTWDESMEKTVRISNYFARRDFDELDKSGWWSRRSQWGWTEIFSYHSEAKRGCYHHLYASPLAVFHTQVNTIRTLIFLISNLLLDFSRSGGIFWTILLQQFGDRTHPRVEYFISNYSTENRSFLDIIGGVISDPF